MLYDDKNVHKSDQKLLESCNCQPLGVLRVHSYGEPNSNRLLVVQRSLYSAHRTVPNAQSCIVGWIQSGLDVDEG